MIVPSAIRLVVPGAPVAQPRTRHAAMKSKKTGKAFVRTYNPDDADGWKNRIYLIAVGHRPVPTWTGAVRIDATFYFPRPDRLEKMSAPDSAIRHTAKPDRDNLDKALLDALKNAQIFRDDAQVCEGEIRKFYVARGHKPGAVIDITYLGESQ